MLYLKFSKTKKKYFLIKNIIKHFIL